MKKTCRTCEDREVCTALCADVEAEVNQDHVSLKELPVLIEDIEHGKVDWPENKGGLTICMSKSEAKTSKLLEKGFSPHEIAYLLDISIQTVYNNTYTLRKKHNNR